LSAISATRFGTAMSPFIAHGTFRYSIVGLGNGIGIGIEIRVG
jgi:hypothetical protein